MLADEVRRRQADGGLGEYQRQCAANRLRIGQDLDGSWWLSGRLDPLSGLTLKQRLDAETNRRFADTVPALCPSDARDKQDFLSAHALLTLTEPGRRRGAVGTPPVELIIVEDHTAAGDDGHPSHDCGTDIPLPPAVIADLTRDAPHIPITLRDGRVVQAPGRLDLGRSARIANLAQRRVLRALYPTCAIPGCPVRYGHLDLHHVHRWEHGGPTDLDNLLPLCSKHHHAVHDHGWHLTLHPDRTLHLTYPDRTTMTTGPPSRRRTAS